MDAGSRCRNPLQEVSSKVVYIPPMAATGVPFKNPLSRQPSGGDRFIPDRSSMDFDVAHYLLTQSRKEKENPAAGSPAKEAYRRMLPQIRAEGLVTDAASDNIAATQQSKPGRQRRYIPQSAERTLDAPDIIDDYYLNLLDWGCSNVLSIALGNTVYLWNANDGSTSEFMTVVMTVDEDDGPVTSVSWAPDGRHIAIGLNSSDVQMWDTCSNTLLALKRARDWRQRVQFLADRILSLPPPPSSRTSSTPAPSR